LYPFDFVSPCSLKEAYALKKEHFHAVYVAGGTDVLPAIKYELISPPLLISLKKIAGLDEICPADDALTIGAMTPLWKLAEYAANHPSLKGLNQAARAVASPQIRTIGTVGGNLLQEVRCFYYNQTATWRSGVQTCLKFGGDICHQAPAKKECPASYYSDLAPVLLAADASVGMFEDEQVKEMSLFALLSSPSARKDSILSHISVPNPDTVQHIFFAKQAVRGAIDFPLASAALVLRSDGAIRLCLGAMTPVPFFLQQTQAALEHAYQQQSAFPPELYEMAQEEANAHMRPIREASVSPTVKKHASKVVTQVMKAFEHVASSNNGRCAKL